jgi:polyisoprenoid-binding protein YceI
MFSFTTSTIQAPTWKISGSHSNVSFEVNHFFTPVQGHFSDFKGELSFDPADLETSSVSFTIQAASIKTDSDGRDKHLKSGDFFNAEKFPEMTFKSTSISKKGKGFIAKGDFTIKGITKSIEVPFKLLGMGDHPSREGVVMIGIKSEFTINRNDYNVGTGDYIATTVISDEVTITVALEGSRKK